MRVAVKNLCLSFGQNNIVNNLNFELKVGDFLEVTASNGSGKTTLLKLVCGLIQPDSGEVIVENPNNIIYLGHKTSLQPELTPLENLNFFACLNNLKYTSCNEIIIHALDKFSIGNLWDTPCKLLSKGQQQRVGLTRLILESSKIWILDEPLLSLDQEGIVFFHSLLKKHLESGGSAIIATHIPISLPNKTLLKL